MPILEPGMSHFIFEFCFYGSHFKKTYVIHSMSRHRRHILKFVTHRLGKCILIMYSDKSQEQQYIIAGNGMYYLCIDFKLDTVTKQTQALHMRLHTYMNV